MINNNSSSNVFPSSTETKSCLQLSVEAAARWWSEFVKKQNSSVSVEILKKFESVLRESILSKIKDHWYPDFPTKGQGYRSLAMDKKAHCDPALQKAAVGAGINEPFVSFMKDVESINMWIDPDAVIVRLSYTGYMNIPPEEKVLYRSQLSIKSAAFPYTKVSPTISQPPSPNRNGLSLRSSPSSNIPLRPPSPPQASQIYGAYRTSSPGLNSTSAPYIPYSSFTAAAKNPYIAQPQRSGMYYNNHGYNQVQYSWGGYKLESENGWNEFVPQNFYQNANFSTKQPQPMYSDYYGPLETQA